MSVEQSYMYPQMALGDPGPRRPDCQHRVPRAGSGVQDIPHISKPYCRSELSYLRQTHWRAEEKHVLGCSQTYHLNNLSCTLSLSGQEDHGFAWKWFGVDEQLNPRI
jgi:hypothetical protein